MRRRLDRDDADRCLPVLLRLQALRSGLEAAQRRLLRLLLLRRCPLPTYPRGESKRQLGGLLLADLVLCSDPDDTKCAYRQRIANNAIFGSEHHFWRPIFA